MSFKIEFEELKFFKEQLKEFPNLTSAIPDISTAIQLFNHTLEDRVNATYATPGTLSSVMVGSSIKPSEIGKTFLRYSLQYRDKPIPLVLYPHTETVVPSSTAKYPKRMEDGGIVWKYKGYALQVNTFIKRDKSVIAKRGKSNYRYKGFLQNGQIFARKGKATWREYPTRNFAGVRAYPLVELQGPSLSKVALYTYLDDSKVQQAKDKVGTDILNAIGKWYP